MVDEYHVSVCGKGERIAVELERIAVLLRHGEGEVVWPIEGDGCPNLALRFSDDWDALAEVPDPEAPFVAEMDFLR